MLNIRHLSRLTIAVLFPAGVLLAQEGAPPFTRDPAAPTVRTPTEPEVRLKAAVQAAIPYADGTNRELRIYDLRRRLEQEGPKLRPELEGHTPRGFGRSPGDDDSPPEFEIERLLTQFVQPSFEGPESVRAIAGTHLVAVARPEQHEWIRRFLDLQVQSAKTQVLVQMQVFTVAPGTEVAGDTPDASPYRFAHDAPVVLDDETAARTMAALKSRGLLDLLSFPALISRPGQRVSLSSVAETSYISDFVVQRFESEDGSRSSEIVDPVIESAEDGVFVRGAVAVLANDRLGVAFDLRVIEQLARPFPTEKVTRGSNSMEFEIQVPRFREVEVDATTILATEETVEFTLPFGQDLLVLRVRVEVLD